MTEQEQIDHDRLMDGRLVREMCIRFSLSPAALDRIAEIRDDRSFSGNYDRGNLHIALHHADRVRCQLLRRFLELDQGALTSEGIRIHPITLAYDAAAELVLRLEEALSLSFKENGGKYPSGDSPILVDPPPEGEE